MRLDVDKILSTAEGIYHQIVSAPHLTDQIRVIIGLPTVGCPPPTDDHSDDEADETEAPSHSRNGATGAPTVNGNATEANGQRVLLAPEMDEVMYQIGLDMNF